MKKIFNAFLLTIVTLVTFSACSDVPAPYDINEGGDGPTLAGDGTKENPYDVASAMKKQDNSEAWVMGYIVGNISDKSISTDAVFAPPFTNAANILIAASADETDYKKCIPVQLVSQTDVRAALNLVDNSTNLGKAVVIYGQLTKYFGVAGIKSPTAAVLDGKDIGEGGDEPTDKDNPLGLDLSKKNNSFSADFEDLVANSDYELLDWYNVAVEGGRRWQGKTFNNTVTGGTDKYIQATSYGGTGTSFECWFATPAFDVDQIKDKKVSFDCAVYNYATASANSKLEVYFLQLVDGKMTTTPLNVVGMPTTDNTWVTLSADLSAQAGKTGFVGFKYTSNSSTEALSYRLDNIKTGSAGGGTDPNPPVEGAIFTETFGTPVGANVNVADYTGWDNPNLAFAVTNPKVNIRAIPHKTEANKTEEQKVNHVWFPSNADGDFTISNINAAANKKFVLKYEIAANTYDAGSTIDLNVLKVAFNDTELAVPSKVVTATVAKDDANIFYEMEVEVNVAGTASSTLKFSAAAATNKLGLRLYNIRLIGKEGGSDPAPGGGSDLFISEYVEGSSFEKYIEIYNPSSQVVDLSAYTLKLEQDGKGTWTKEFNLSGSIPSHGVVVYRNSQAVKYTGETIVNNDVINFNGNDPVGLFKNGELTDLFGVSSDTPGTAVADFAKDKTFRRKATIKAPSKVYKSEEWDELGKDDVSGLGSHTMN